MRHGGTPGRSAGSGKNASGLGGGKSIGFLTLKAHAPTDDEIKKRPELAKVRRIVEEWQLVEYACTWMPMNPEAVVESTAKAMKALGIEVPRPPAPAAEPDRVIRFTPLAEVEKAVRRALASPDVDALDARAVADAADRARGRV